MQTSQSGTKTEIEEKLIGEIFLEEGYCSKEDIEKALEVQKNYGGKLGTILLNMGVITEEKLLKALAKQLGLEYIPSVEGYTVIDIGVDHKILKENNIYPFKEDEDFIHIVTNNPLNLEAFSLIENTTGKQVKVYLSKEENLKQLAVFLDLEDVLAEKDNLLDIDEEIDKLKEIASEAPVIKLVNNLLSKAVEENASDIHFEALKNVMKVRFRVDGILHTVETIPQDMKLAVITRLKLISGMNIAENRLPQDGRISVKVAGKEIDIRASSVPTQFGESFVLRLLGKENIDYSLESLGFYEDHINLIRQIVRKPNGIFLTTGPTGSGKTTTLYSILSELNSDDVKIITVEDPVEYEFKGINQINVKPDIGYTFANALRSILRQDPDIIMVGEIRDLETAEIAIQASLTGHLVLSTLHTNSALASISRLLDMGVEFFLLKASIIGLMAQRLVRTLCPYCSQPVSLPEEFKKAYKVEELLEKYPFVTYAPKKAEGCKHCNYTGYKGRTIIAEIVPFDEEVIKRFDREKNFNRIEELGYRSMFTDGVLKVLEGKTSIEEVIRVAS
ncbi:MAG: Flp pilus assembly complex ATPase component [Aquificae bacterium]|nr:Flp pilus assembly complex ATPase component [Aquificota bacterium]